MRYNYFTTRNKLRIFYHVAAAFAEASRNFYPIRRSISIGVS